MIAGYNPFELIKLYTHKNLVSNFKEINSNCCWLSFDHQLERVNWFCWLIGMIFDRFYITNLQSCLYWVRLLGLGSVREVGQLGRCDDLMFGSVCLLAVVVSVLKKKLQATQLWRVWSHHCIYLVISLEQLTKSIHV